MLYTVTENTLIAKNTWRILLSGDTETLSRPGQFVQVKVPEFYLRRPISVCDWDESSLCLIYKIVGSGTHAMAQIQAGESVDLLTGLGNGFTVKSCKPLLIGGGCGVPPLYGLCKALLKAGMKPSVILGFNSQEDVFLAEEFKALDVQVIVTTVDGSLGMKGYATEAAQEMDFDYIYTCGPDAMLKAVYKLCDERGISGQFSLEERMACGFGACMGCSIQLNSGAKRVCKDGPVFEKEELPW